MAPRRIPVTAGHHAIKRGQMAYDEAMDRCRQLVRSAIGPDDPMLAATQEKICRIYARFDHLRRTIEQKCQYVRDRRLAGKIRSSAGALLRVSIVDACRIGAVDWSSESWLRTEENHRDLIKRA